MPKHIDLSGQIFRGILVLSVSHIDPTRHEYHYNCRCHCGKEFALSVSGLRNPQVKGCGCRQEARKHGLINTPEYRIWAAMKRRCLNPRSIYYEHYGGRGIKICDRWLDFKNFFADMGNRPSPHHSIDRINNNGDYSPENCRWATTAEQTRNRRSNRLLTLNGETMTLADWSVRVSVTGDTIDKRLERGWTVEKALTTPTRPHKEYIKVR